MAKFRYALQKVVDFTMNERNQAEWIFAQALSEKEMENTKLNRLLDEREWVTKQMEENFRRISVSELRAKQEYITHLEQLIRKQQQVLEESEHKVEEKRLALGTKMKDEKVWEKAREKALELFTSHAGKQEQQQLDEMATARFFRP